MFREWDCILKLKEWEDLLSQQIPFVMLLGELQISERDRDEIAQHIRELLSRQGAAEGTYLLTRRYSTVLAVFLVAQGVYSYKDRNFWGDVCARTGLPSQNYPVQWKQSFERFLRLHRLPAFSEIQEPHHRFVTPILAHGGIPDKCLPDFFKNLLQPAIDCEEWSGFSARELINEWRSHKSVFVTTDKPVRRFLLYGGKVAESFLERCLDMAQRARETGEVPSAEDIGLQLYVVEAYRAWLGQKPIPSHTVTSRLPQFNKPIVSFDAGYGELFLELPAQSLPPNTPPNAISWQISAGGDSRTVSARLRRRGEMVETEEQRNLPLGRAAIYRISFLIYGQAQKVWDFNLSKERLLLAFEPERGRLLEWDKTLPAQPLWVLFPEGYTLEGESSKPVPILAELAQPMDDWVEYQAMHIDLSGLTQLILRADNRPVHRISLETEQPRAALYGGNPLDFARSGMGEIPLYIGSSPFIRIPIPHLDLLPEEEGAPDEDVERFLHRWSLSIRPCGRAHPRNERSVAVSKIVQHLHLNSTHVDIPLSLPELLGEAPIGEFEVIVRGLLGQDEHLFLRIIPTLEISGHERIVLPQPQTGHCEITIIMRTSPNTMVRCETTSNLPLVERDEGKIAGVSPGRVLSSSLTEYTVTIPPDATYADVILASKLPDGSVCELPLNIPIWRLRWKLTGIEELPSFDWSAKCYEITIDALEQASNIALLVDAPTNETEKVRLNLELYSADGHVLREAGWQTVSTRRLRFGLEGFSDSLRALSVLGFRLRVEVRLRAEQTKSISLPVLHIFGIRLKKDDRFVSEQTVWWEDLDSYQFVIIGGAGETAEILIDGSRSQTVLLSSLKVLTPGHSPKGERGYEQQEIAEVRLSQLRPFICKSSTQVTVRCQGLEKRIAIKMNACILLFDYLDETSNQIESGQIAFKTVLKGPTDLKAKFTAFSPMGEKLTEKTISCPGLQERAYQETLSVSSEREVTVKASVQDAERRYVAYSQELRFEAVDAATLIVKYEQQLQSNPENSEIRYRLAQLYDKQGDYEKAASHYRQLLTHLQKDIPKLLSIAEFFERHGNEREALDSYRKAYEWEPQNSQIKQRYILCWLKHPWLTENELYRIWQFIYSGQQPQNDAQIHFLSGIRFYVIGKAKDALFCFEQCQTFPDATLVWMYKSIACFCDGRYEKAREYAAQVLSERPGAFDPWPQLIQIASCYLQQNRESFEQELSQPPDTLSIKAQSIPTDLILRPNEIHLLQAIYYYLKGQFDKAKSHIDQVEPESECAKVVKARIYRRIIGGKEIAKDLYIDLYRRNSLDYCKEAETYLREIGCL